MSGNLINSIGRTAYQLAFQISPIIFVDGIAQSTWGYLPIIAITETGYSFASSIGSSAFELAGAAFTSISNLANGNFSSLDNFFAQFSPIGGSKLANFQIGGYPFANQSVAANAIISEPLPLSIRMAIPVRDPGGHSKKLVVMSALRAAIQKHAALGGTYIVATPAAFYSGCILTGLTDASNGGDAIPQNAYQWDFIIPLTSIQQAEAAQNTLMSKISGGLPTDGTNIASATGTGTQNLFTSNPSGQGIAISQGGLSQ